MSVFSYQQRIKKPLAEIELLLTVIRIELPNTITSTLRNEAISGLEKQADTIVDIIADNKPKPAATEPEAATGKTS